MKQPAIFLDRDGTIMEEVHYCKDPALVRLLPGAVEALRGLQAAGFALVMVTNQCGIARGLLTQKDFDAVQARLFELLGFSMPVYMCPDGPDTQSTHRKPAPGMLLDAAKELGLDLSQSWMVGDKEADVQAGRAAGTRAILVRTGHGVTENGEFAHFVAADLASAAAIILGESGAS
jgi:D-glycero-D-manno-heptose 1,7-bisphosphate phosphatase